MNNLLRNNLQPFFIYSGIWIILTVIHISLLNYYFPDNGLNRHYLLYDTIVCNFLQAVCILILSYPVKYTRSALNLPLTLLFHALFFMIVSVVCMGLGFLITPTLLPNYQGYTVFFLTILPARIILNLLIYIAFVLVFYLLLIHGELKVQKQNIIEKSVETVPVPKEKLTRIIVKKNSEFHCITVSQILYIEANGDYVLIYADSGRYLKDGTMKYWETHLPDDFFVRIHRSFIVNIEKITKIELYEKESYKVHLKNGDGIKASVSGYRLLKQKMKM